MSAYRRFIGIPFIISIIIITSTKGGVRSIVMSMSVCLSACLSVRSHTTKTRQPNFSKFLCTLPMNLTGSSSGGVVIRYVGPFWPFCG